MNQWGNKEGRQVIWKPTPKNIISLICFHVKRLESGKDDSSSETYFRSSKTSRDSHLDPELYILVQILEFYLVSQSLLIISKWQYSVILWKYR